MVMSGVSRNSRWIRSASASIRDDRRSPPRGFATGAPCSFASARHRLTLAALTPKRSPTARWLIPSETAARTRVRRSRERVLGMTTGPLPGHHCESEKGRCGNPLRFNRVGYRSRECRKGLLASQRDALESFDTIEEVVDQTASLVDFIIGWQSVCTRSNLIRCARLFVDQCGKVIRSSGSVREEVVDAFQPFDLRLRPGTVPKFARA